MARHGHLQRRGTSTVRPGLWLLVLLAAVGCGERGEEPGAGGDGRDVEPAAARGLIVERVTPGGAAAVAGVQAGDILLAWRREEPGGARTSRRALAVVRCPLGRGAARGARGRRAHRCATRRRRTPRRHSSCRSRATPGALGCGPRCLQPAESAFRARLAAMDADDAGECLRHRRRGPRACPRGARVPSCRSRSRSTPAACCGRTLPGRQQRGL